MADTDVDKPAFDPTQPFQAADDKPPFDPNQPFQAAGSNDEPADHGLSERQKLSPLGKALSPITSYPETYSRMNREARDTMGRGLDEVTHPEGVSDFTKGVGRLAAGAAGYVASPISAAYRSVIGQPVEDVTGIPREYTEFAAQLATPGIGFTKLPKAPPRPVEVPGGGGGATPTNSVVDAAGRISQATDVNVRVPRAFSSDSVAVQRAAQLAKNAPFVGDSIPRAVGDMADQLGAAKNAVASHYGEGSGPNVANRIGHTIQDAAETETNAATEAARLSDEAVLADWRRFQEQASTHIGEQENAALERARAATGSMSPQDMGEALINRLRSGEAAARSRKDQLYREAEGTDAAVNAGSVRSVHDLVSGAIYDAGRVIDPQLTPAANAMMGELRNFSDLIIPNRVGPPTPRAADIAGVNIEGINQVRKRLGNMAQSASTDGDRAAASIIMRQFDNWQTAAFDSALYSGDPEALATIRRANAANRTWRQGFYNDRDDADRIINRVVTGEVTPQEMANWLVGASQIGAKGVSSRLLTRIGEVTDNDPETIEALRSGVAHRLLGTTEGVTPKNAQAVANQIHEFFNGSGSDVARRLYTPEQRAAALGYANTLRRAHEARQLVTDVAATTRPTPMPAEPGPMRGLANSVLGKSHRSDEALFSAIDSYAKSGGRGDIKTLADIVRSIPERDRGDLAGAIIRRLGHTTQTEGFSLEKFATEWKKYTPQAKALLFGNAGPHRQALDDIATISQRYKEVGRRFGNPSGTGQTLIGAGELAALWTHPLVSIPSLVGAAIFAKMLAAPAGASKVANLFKQIDAMNTNAHSLRLGAFRGALKAVALAANKEGANISLPHLLQKAQGPGTANADEKRAKGGSIKHLIPPAPIPDIDLSSTDKLADDMIAKATQFAGATRLAGGGSVRGYADGGDPADPSAEDLASAASQHLGVGQEMADPDTFDYNTYKGANSPTSMDLLNPYLDQREGVERGFIPTVKNAAKSAYGALSDFGGYTGEMATDAGKLGAHALRLAKNMATMPPDEVKETPEYKALDRAMNALTGAYGTEDAQAAAYGTDRYQLWPEKMVRSGLTLPHEIQTGELSNWAYDPDTNEVIPNPEVTKRVQDMTGMAGGASVATRAEEAAGANSVYLGATPFLRPALKYGDRVYKAPIKDPSNPAGFGAEHSEALPPHLQDDFYKKAAAGDDINQYNFGYVNHKGQFLSREAALDYGVKEGLVDPQDARYGTLTTTMLSDSGKSGAPLSALERAAVERRLTDQQGGFTNLGVPGDRDPNTGAYIGQVPKFRGRDDAGRFQKAVDPYRNLPDINTETFGAADTSKKPQLRQNGRFVTQADYFRNRVPTPEELTRIQQNEFYNQQNAPSMEDLQKVTERQQSDSPRVDPAAVEAWKARMPFTTFSDTSEAAPLTALERSLRQTRDESGRLSQQVVDELTRKLRARYPDINNDAVQSWIDRMPLLSDSGRPGAPLSALERGFYSQVEKTIQDAPQSKMHGVQWANWLKNQPGVKPEELQHAGLDDWLRSQNRPLTKQEVADFFNKKKLKLGEAVSTEVPSDFGKLSAAQRNAVFDKYHDIVGRPPHDVGELKDWYENIAEYSQKGNETGLDDVFGRDHIPKYREYTLPGGSNYREHRLTLPSRGEVAPEARAASNYPDNYQSQHWDEPNVVGHLRLTDRDVAAPEEAAQAKTAREAYDAHQAKIEDLRKQQGEIGKQINEKAKSLEQAYFKKAYEEAGRRGDFKALRKIQKERPEFPELRPLQSKLQKLREAEDDLIKDSPPKPEGQATAALHLEELQSDWSQAIRNKGERGEAQALLKKQEAGTITKDEAKRLDKIIKHGTTGGVLPTPFRSTPAWAGLLLKRALVEAADSGKSRVSWTPGEAQPTNPKNVGGGHGYTKEEREAADKGMRGFYNDVLPKLAERIGKDYGVKVREGTTEIGKPDNVKLHRVGNLYRVIDGSGRTIPNSPTFKTAAEARKWVDGNEYTKQKVYYFDIPEKMRDNIRDRGFQLFSDTGREASALSALERSDYPSITKTPRGAQNAEKVQAATDNQTSRDVRGGVENTSGGSEGLRAAQLQAERRAAGRPTLPGLPTQEQIVDGKLYIPGPYGKAHEVAEQYIRDRAPPSYHRPPEKYYPLDKEHSKAIAKAYEEMKHDPNDPAVRASYEALIRETLAQYQAIKNSGLRITPVNAKDYPYEGNPRAVAKDVADNNHMAFFKTDEGFGTGDAIHPDNPMLRSSGEKIGDHDMLNNDIFRVVHDYFGHIKNGYGFRAQGEDNAWRAHASMYSDLARPAMTTETRGQNSWVNYGPHGEHNRTASGADTIYAPQKVGLMPEWTMRDRGSPEPIMAYHGTPYAFDQFDINRIGSGEGNQAYGQGLYFAGHSPVSEWYRYQLAARRDPLLKKYGLDEEQGAHTGIELANAGGDVNKLVSELQAQVDSLKAENRTDKATKNMIRDREAKIGYLTDPDRAQGHLYEVAIDHPPESFLDWDRPLQEQPPAVQNWVATHSAAARLQGPDMVRGQLRDPTGEVIYRRLRATSGTPEKEMASAGIRGIRYKDQGSRNTSSGTHNYVTFDAPRIVRRLASDTSADAPISALANSAPKSKYYEGEPVSYFDVNARPNKKIQTVADPYRMGFPGIYRNPKLIAEEAASRVGEEDPAMKQLFGVDRGDLREMAKDRVGNEEPKLKLASNPRGSLAAQNIQTPKNTQRLVDILSEAGKHEGLRTADAWYIQDPVYQRLAEMFGPEEARRRYSHLNTMTGMASPGSDVLTEIQRGTGAHWLEQQGRFNDFLKYAGMTNDAKNAVSYPRDMRAIPGHPYHRTSQAEPMQKYLKKGEIQSEAPKVPLYVHASGVPETGFQTSGPVGDAHFSRGVGLSDTRRGPSDVQGSFSTGEYQTLQPWWQQDVANEVGLESVPAQARLWTALGPQTGVESELGAPKLELLAKMIMRAARRHNITPERARDLILSGKMGAFRDGGAVDAEGDADDVGGPAQHQKTENVVARAGGGRVLVDNIDQRPTEKQKESGNYRKDHVSLFGLDFTIENAKGMRRSGVGRGGKAWEVTMPAHYGYIKRSKGADGDHVDVYLGPHPKSRLVFIVNQVDADTKKFDEHKCLLCFGSLQQALNAYKKGFSDGRGEDRVGSVVPTTIDKFKSWLKGGNTKRPFV